LNRLRLVATALEVAAGIVQKAVVVAVVIILRLENLKVDGKAVVSVAEVVADVAVVVVVLVQVAAAVVVEVEASITALMKAIIAETVGNRRIFQVLKQQLIRQTHPEMKHQLKSSIALITKLTQK
jgi:hypothetical protein